MTALHAALSLVSLGSPSTEMACLTQCGCISQAIGTLTYSFETPLNATSRRPRPAYVTVSALDGSCGSATFTTHIFTRPHPRSLVRSPRRNRSIMESRLCMVLVRDLKRPDEDGLLCCYYC